MEENYSTRHLYAEKEVGLRFIARTTGHLLLFTLFGMTPYLLGGYIPSVADAFFETMSSFTIVLLPGFGAGSRVLYLSEATGVTHDKICPQTRIMVRYIWTIYLLLTTIETLSLTSMLARHR